MKKQDRVRKDFIRNWFNDEFILANFNDRELIIETGNKEFPFIRLTLAALDEEQGDKRISELIEKQNIYNDRLDK